MNHDRIIDQDLIGRYRADTLGAEDAEAFEAHLLGCVECQALLDSELRLERGVRTIAARAASAAATPAAARWSASRRTTLAAVAVLATVFAVPWLASQRFDAAEPAPQANLTMFQFALTRGAREPLTELTVPADAAWYALELEVPATAEQRCRVVIAAADGAVIWQDEAVIDPDSGVVRVLLNRDLLPGGDYLIALRALAPDAPTLIEHRVRVKLGQ